ncbi:hypothetical protein MBLNU13_g09364t1 [Cladosporium sp. NU13]
MVNNLFGGMSAIQAWQLDLGPYEASPLNGMSRQDEKEIEAHLANICLGNGVPRATLIVLSQKHSRSLLNITSEAFDILEALTQSSNKWRRMLDSFRRNGSDCYVGFAALHFTPPASLGIGRFELCCNLKYIERHGRKPFTTAENQQIYNLSREWSIRQQAICAISDSPDRREVLILIRPSATLSSNVANASTNSANGRPVATGWTDVLLLVCENLTDGWPIYINALHEAVEQIKQDAAHTDVRKPNLETARELEFHRSQVQLIHAQLDAAVLTIRDLISLRNAHTTENMTARTILEARSVRIIALVTMFFLPPTFVSGFLDMGYIAVTRDGWRLNTSTEPGLMLYLCITVPLVMAVVGCWICWDGLSMREARTQRDGEA